MPSDLRQQIKETMNAVQQKVESEIERWAEVHSAEQFRAMEQEVTAVMRAGADAVVSDLLRAITRDPVFQVETARAARQGGTLRDGGSRDVHVKLLGGSEVCLNVRYLKPNRRGKPGRRRRNGARGKGGVGLYPILAALGIWFGVTPAVADEVSRQVADSDSVRAGRAALARRGLDFGHKETLRLVNKFGHRAVEQRDAWLKRVTKASPATGVLRGKRVLIGTDGGRMRERVAKRGRRRKTGHHGYHSPWREPKLLVIYVIGPDGKVEDTFRPIYDATLGDCDVVFNMMLGYLKALGADQAQELVFVGDGAKWIWERAAVLAERLGLDPSRLTEVVDWYHAVETLHTISKVPAKWSEKQRARWVRRAKKHLHKGRTEEVVKLIDELSVGRRAKKVKKHRNYFVRNHNRMQYKSFIEAGIPIGSGAVESAVRRVINLRIKGPAKFWDEANGQGMLMLRSYLKAGRFDDLVLWSLQTATPWWQPDDNSGVASLIGPALELTIKTA